MTLFRSVGGRLSFALLLLVAGALAIVYVVVIPSLERSLVNDRLDELERDARTAAAGLKDEDRGAWPLAIVGYATLMNARVTALDVSSPDAAEPFYDSSGKYSDVVRDPLALRAAVRFRVARGRVDRNDRSYAEVAVPLDRNGAVLVTNVPGTEVQLWPTDLPRNGRYRELKRLAHHDRGGTMSFIAG